MSQKMVTIIIPMYNVEKYIKKCILSIIEQTYKNIEILVLDDASTDQSLDVVKEYEKKDKRIQVKSFSINKGADYARKQGILLAKGQYIMFVDADDWIDKQTIEKCIESIEKYNCDIVRFGIVRELLTQNRKIYFKKFCEKETYVKKEDFTKYIYLDIITTYNYNSMCGQIIKKELLQENLEENNLIMAEDLYLNLNLLNKVESVVLLPDYLYHYRYNEKSVTTINTKEKIEKKLADIIIVYAKFFDYIEKWNLKKEYEKTVSLRILREITNQYLCLFLIKNINIKEIQEIDKNITNQDIMNKIRNTITIGDVKKSNYENIKAMEYLLNGNFKKLHVQAKMIYKNKMKIKKMIKKFFVYKK